MKKELFEAKVKYVKLLDSGVEKKVTEAFLVDALTVSEAETRVIKKLKSSIRGEFSVEAVKKASFKEFFGSDGERFYNCKIVFVIISDDGQEKRQKNAMLVQADDFQDALDHLEDGMKGTVSDWEIFSITETSYQDII